MAWKTVSPERAEAIRKRHGKSLEESAAAEMAAPAPAPAGQDVPVAPTVEAIEVNEAGAPVSGDIAAPEIATPDMAPTTPEGGGPFALADDGPKLTLAASGDLTAENFAQKVDESRTVVPDPDGFARDIKLSDQSGVAFSLLDDPEMRKYAEQAVKNGDVTPSYEIVERTKTGKWAMDEANMALSWDDLDRMNRSADLIENLIGGAKAGALTTDLGQARFWQLYNGVFGDGDIWAENEDVTRILAELESIPQSAGLVSEMFAGAGRTLGQRKDPLIRGAKYMLYAGSIAMGVVAIAGSGGTATPLVASGLAAGSATLLPTAVTASITAGEVAGRVESMFMTEAGLAFDNLLQIRDENGQPLPNDVIVATSVLTGAASAGLEFLQLNMILKSIPGLNRFMTTGVVQKALANPTTGQILRRFAGDYLKLLGSEVATEIAQEGVQIVGEEVAKAYGGESFAPATAEGIVERLGETAGESIISFSLGLAPGPAMSAAGIGRTVRADEAVRKSDIVEGTIEATKDLKIVARNSDAARSFIGTITEGSPVESVYVNPRTIQTMFQEGRIEDVGEVLESLNVEPDAFAEAVATGADMEVPLADFVQAVHETGLKDELLEGSRFDASGYSLREALDIEERRQQVIREETAEAARLIQEDADIRESAVQVRTNVATQLEGIGRSAEEAGALGDMVAGAMTVAARREGMSPYEFYNRLGVTFTAEGDEILMQRAWHGSPHRFDKFSTAEIGGGEGAQAYGWGLYFAGDRKISEWYRTGLSSAPVSYININGTRYAVDGDAFAVDPQTGDWNDIKNPVEEAAAYALNSSYGDIPGALEYLEDRKAYLEKKGDTAEISNTDKAIELVESGNFDYVTEIEANGQLYEVNIPNEEYLLDRDKSIEDQPERIKKLLKQDFDAFEGELTSLRAEGRAVTELGEPIQSNGRFFYAYLEDREGSDKAASEYLNSKGIKGLQYLDANSRSKGDGTRNYVIFDDNAVEIANTYYQAGINPGVDLDRQVGTIGVEERFQGMGAWRVRNKFPKEIRKYVLSSFGENGIENEDSGWKLTLSGAGFDHLRNTMSRDVKETGVEHYEVIAAIPDIARHGVLVESYDDQYGVPEIKKMHRLFAPVRVGEDVYSVRILVKEYQPGVFGIEDKDNAVTAKKIYDHTVEKKLAAGTSQNAEQGVNLTQPPGPTAADSYTLRELIDGVKDSDGVLYNEAFGNLRQDGSAGVRGSIQLPSDPSVDGVRITLTPNADVTTGIHELGHLFLWISDRQARAFAEDAQLQADMRTVRDFVGWEDGQETFTRDQHEKFADAYIEYVREGKAPSRELQSAFRRFKKWLVDFYRAIRGNPRIELSEEMRGVFDRMLATEDQIEALAAESDFAGVLDPADSGGVADRNARVRDDIKETAKETVLAKLLRELSPERMAETEVIRRATEKEVRKQVAREPIYRAIEAMRGDEALKISDELLAEEFGDQAIEGLPPGITAQEGGLHPDDAADALGYGSGDELVQKLLAAPDFEDEVGARVDAQMRGVTKSAADDGRIAGMADDAMRGDESLQSLIVEHDDIAIMMAEAEDASPEAWAEITAADELARAEQSSPRSRTNVVNYVVEHGGIKLAALKERYHPDDIRELRQKMPVAAWQKNGFGLDELAQDMAYNGIPVNGGDDLFSILMGENPPVSPLQMSWDEGFSAARAYAKQLNERKRQQQSARQAERTERAETRAAERIVREVGKELDRRERDEAIARIDEQSQIKAKAVQDAARTMVREKNNADVLKMKGLSTYIAAEKRARSEYKEALRDRNWQAATEAKGREILNHALAMELKAASKEVAADDKYMAGLRHRKAAMEKVIERSRLEQIDGLAERFNFQPPSRGADSRKSLDRFLYEQELAGYPNDVATEIANGSLQKPWWELTTRQFHDLADAVRWLEHNGREASRLSKEFENRNLDEQGRKLAEHIEQKSLDLGIEGERSSLRRGKIDGAKSFFSSASASLTKMEFITRMLDGFEDIGTAWNMLFRPITEAQDRENRLTREYTGLLRAWIDQHYTPKQWQEMVRKKKWYGNIGVNISHDQAIVVALNSGNRTNMERLMTGEGWNQHQLQSILWTLTENDWHFVQGVWDLIDTLWPQIAELQRDMTGVTPQKVYGDSFYVMPSDWKGGGKGLKIEGGYYPIAYDRNESRIVREMTERQMMEDMFESQYAQAATRHGHTEARAKSTGFKLRMDLGVIPEHLTNVIHDLSFRRAVIDVNKLVRHGDVRDAIIRSVGNDMYDQIRPWLQSVARQEYQPTSYIMKVFNAARRRSQVVVLGLKASVSLFQYMGFLPAAHRIGPARLARHILSFYATPWEWTKKAQWVWEKSEEMRSRATNRDRDVRAVIKDLQAKGKWDSMQNSFFQVINVADASVTIPIWNAAYEKGIKRFGWDEKRAIQYADTIVRNTQDIGTTKDLSAIQRGGDFQKFFTMFYNAANTQYNMLQEEYLKLKTGNSSWQDAIGAFFWLLAAPAIIGALRYASTDDEEEDDVGTWDNIWWGIKALAQYPLGLIPLVRDVAQSVDSGRAYRPSAVFEVFDQPRKTVLTAKSAIKAAKEGDDVNWKQVTSEGLMTAGYVFGLPAGQLKIISNAMFDLLEGDKDVGLSDFFLYRKR